MDWDDLIRSEEKKRHAAYDPAARWLHIQQTITWAEANLPRHLQRNRPRPSPTNPRPPLPPGGEPGPDKSGNC